MMRALLRCPTRTVWAHLTRHCSAESSTSSSSSTTSSSPPSSTSATSSEASTPLSRQTEQEAEWRRKLERITEYYSQYEAEYSGEEDPNVEWIRPELETFPISTERGGTGVFDLDELVEFLVAEKAKDVFVARQEGRDPTESVAADFIVICSPFSDRHMRALFQRLDKLYKKKKTESDPFLTRYHQKPETPVHDWLALDMGNILLHIMTPECRSKYDLEQLAAVGPRLDAESQDARAAGVASATAWLNAIYRDRQPPPRIGDRTPLNFLNKPTEEETAAWEAHLEKAKKLHANS